MPSIGIIERPSSLHNVTDYDFKELFRESNTSYPDSEDMSIFSGNSVTFPADPLYNGSYVITDSSLLPNSQNTPLTAPELDLVTAKDDDFFHRLLGGSSADTDDLAWLIPACIAVIVLFVIVALLMYYCIRHAELRMMRWCHYNCPCCPCGRSRDGETVALTSENLLVNQTELKEYRTTSNPFD